MGAILGHNQGTIEEDLLALKRGYVVFLPTLGGIAFIPIKSDEIRETIHPQLASVYGEHIQNLHTCQAELKQTPSPLEGEG